MCGWAPCAWLYYTYDSYVYVLDIFLFSHFFFGENRLQYHKARGSGHTREQRQQRRHIVIFFVAFVCASFPRPPCEFRRLVLFSVLRLGSTRNSLFRINILFTGHRSSSVCIVYTVGCCVQRARSPYCIPDPHTHTNNNNNNIFRFFSRMNRPFRRLAPFSFFASCSTV